MSARGPLTLEMTLIEGAHLAGLVAQFRALLADTTSSPGSAPADPAIARLVPDAYPDDVDASREFRSVTETDLLRRRDADAAAVLASLSPDGTVLTTEGLDTDRITETFVVELDDDASGSWLRTLAALRLVLASRLGIDDEDDHDERDPRFGIYDWLGYRLDGLVAALGA